MRDRAAGMRKIADIHIARWHFIPHGPLQRKLEVSPMMFGVGIQQTPDHLLIRYL